MKRIVITIVFFSIVLISFNKSAELSNIVETTLFPAHLVINNKLLDLTGSPVLNYEGKAYIPIRDFVEGMGGVVTYDERNKEIQARVPSQQDKTFEVNQLTKEGDFFLYIHVDKRQYNYGELPDIRGSFLYSGKDDLVIGHGAPMLLFYIKDSQGNFGTDISNDYLKEEIMHSHTMYTSIFSWDRIVDLNFMKSGYTDPKEFLAATPNPWLLEKGEYTVGVKFEHLINGKNVKLTSEAKIEIK